MPPPISTLLLLLLVVASLAVLTHTLAVGVGPTLIHTNSGPVSGASNSSARYWKGIPYAAPPVGNLRWANPVEPTPWSSPLNATEFGPACPQQCQLPPAACEDNLSEDCLSLNVFAPLDNTTTLLPVMVFFHGGRFEQGAEGVGLYVGSQIANFSNTIVVTANYRLGVLGWMTSKGGFTGNYGLRDQRLALQWVQANIGNFGGDAQQVTIFGQSAGGSSVSAHLVSRASYGLFKRAIIESAPYSLNLLPEKAYTHYNVFALEAGCLPNDATCLRKLSWQKVVEAQRKAEKQLLMYLEYPLVLFMPWTPVIDGTELTSDPLTLMDQGVIAPNVDAVILGNVAEEARLFVYDAFSHLSKAEVELFLGYIFHGHLQEILNLYPMPKDAADYRDYMSDIASDFIIICSGRNVTNALNQKVAFYRYWFDHTWSVPDAWGPQYPFCEGHVCHGSELPFVFASASELGYNFTQAENQLAAVMAKSWGAFARTGNPNIPDLPPWPQHNVDDDASMYFTTNGSYIAHRLRAQFCNYWDRTGYILPPW